MIVLLPAFDYGWRAVRCRRRRRDQLYGGGQLLGSLMRHLCGLEAIEVRLLPGGVVGPARVGLLVAAAGAA